MIRCLNIFLFILITMSITLPRTTYAVGGPVTIEKFLDFESDATDEQPEDNNSTNKAETVEPIYIAIKSEIKVKLASISFLETLPSFIASYMQVFHVPPSL